MEKETVLIVDDEETIRYSLGDFLEEQGYEVRLAETTEEGLEFLRDKPFALALVDLVLPGMNGIRLLGEVKQSSPDTEVVMMTSHASVETAIQAIRRGAYDYLEKPFEDLDQVLVTVERALERRRLTLKNRELLQDLKSQNRQLADAVERLTSLIDAGRAMSAIYELPELLDYFIGLVVKELDAERASLMLLNGDDSLRIVASRGISREVVETVRVKVDEGIAGRVARLGKPLLVRNVKTDLRMQHHVDPSLSESFISAPLVLSIPIKLQEKVLGVINVTNRRADGIFDDEDMAFLYGLAGQAAVAIEGARQFEELRQTHETLKAAQDHLVATERLKAMGQMAAGVAHDFNNLLNGILGRAELLGIRLGKSQLDAETIRSELKIIEKITLQGAETLRRIQEFSRIRKDAFFGAVDMNGVVRNAVEITRTKWKDECESQGIEVEIRTDLGDIPLTSGNVQEITQVVTNLIFNAVEAMPEGGRVTLKTYREEDWIRLEVSDTGIGMSEEIRKKVFEPFFSTKDNGQGLGTSIIYGIVARHQGEISVHSEEGSGTTFRLSLPVRAPDPIEHALKADEPTDERDSLRVLIVDDSKENREVFGDYLADMGHRPVLAETGRDALAAFERDSIDLVITDLSMPGMSGWQVAKKIKELNPEMPVILVSGWAIQQEERRLHESGVDGIIQKPCSMADLREAVEVALRPRSEASGAEMSYEVVGE